jgi:hypothetical protein
MQLSNPRIACAFLFFCSIFFRSFASVVLLPNGNPASDARAVALASTHFLRIDGLEIDRRVELDDGLLDRIRMETKQHSEHLPQIIGIQNGKDGEIKIQTRNRPFGGRFYHFKKLPDGTFEQTGGGGWVS